ncbi:Second mitotic wave missing [Strongyloides ratti]|uniref:Second mitotic wave missing n=1 Tax=Strongyloides ratti TaxID=34506 RepID=A0A090L4V3_STRRB|nr:Second mitotic wave missing [Strongyloides ratti]CEF64826.1 Second mitotic wave missing [Strongyloides ratti]
MPINIVDEKRLYQWMIKTLEKTTDANPNTLSKYVVAMLSKTDSLELLEKVLPDKIRVFLQDESDTFGKELCDTIRTGNYLNCDSDEENKAKSDQNDDDRSSDKVLSPSFHCKESSPDLRSSNTLRNRSRSRSKSYTRSRSRSRTPPPQRYDRGRRYSPTGRRSNYDDRYKNSRKYDSPPSRHTYNRKRVRSYSRSRSRSPSPIIIDRYNNDSRRKEKRHDDGSTKAICTNFSKTGTCKYGSRCNFLHISSTRDSNSKSSIMFNSDFSKPPPGIIPQMSSIQGLPIGQFQTTSIFNPVPMIQQFHPPLVVPSDAGVLGSGTYQQTLIPQSINNRGSYNNVQFRNLKTVTDPSATLPIPSCNTLELRKCPQELNTIAKLDEYFSTFGKIINIQVNFEGDPEAALITFSEHNEAVKAFSSEKAIFDNRFIKLFWYRPEKKNGINKNDNKSIVKTIVKKQPIIYPSQEAWLKKREEHKKMMLAQKNREITLRKTAEECINVYRKKVTYLEKLKSEIDDITVKLKAAKTPDAKKGYQKCFNHMSDVYLTQTKELKELNEQINKINEELKKFEKSSTITFGSIKGSDKSIDTGNDSSTTPTNNDEVSNNKNVGDDEEYKNDQLEEEDLDDDIISNINNEGNNSSSCENTDDNEDDSEVKSNIQNCSEDLDNTTLNDDNNDIPMPTSSNSDNING